jgi:putative ABC transport system ATP-binding protein
LSIEQADVNDVRERFDEPAHRTVPMTGGIRAGGAGAESRDDPARRESAGMEAQIIARLSGVDKVYESEGVRLNALTGVNLTLYRRDFAVLVGASGSGKSTLLHVLGTLDRPTKGEVLIGGVDVTAHSDAALSRLRLKSLGFIFQSFNLVDVLTVYENIEYPLIIAGVRSSAARDRVAWLMEQVGLTAHRNHRVTHLSGGQRQRVAIARALANGPSLVLADEPTAALDSKTGETILDLLHHLNETEHATFLIATHDPRVMSHARRTITIADGAVADHDREETREVAYVFS